MLLCSPPVLECSPPKKKPFLIFWFSFEVLQVRSYKDHNYIGRTISLVIRFFILPKGYILNVKEVSDNRQWSGSFQAEPSVSFLVVLLKPEPISRNENFIMQIDWKEFDYKAVDQIVNPIACSAI